jgi:isoleucyl-tRNA synthetase
LESWPEEFVGEMSKDEIELLENMKETRNIVSLGLEARAKSGLKVRQPLNSLKVKGLILKDKKEFLELIKDEVNVKEVIFDESIIESVELDKNITPELKEEGISRDIIRSIQEMRKNKKLNPEDLIELFIETDENTKKLIEKFEKEISKTTGIKKILFEEIADGEMVEFEGFKIKMAIKI